jgi:DNA-binding NarL/FixJ family response regulator
VRDLIELQPDMRVVGEIADCAAAPDLIAQQHPDVVLLDARLQGPAGSLALHLVQHAAPGVSIVVYAANPAPGDAEAVLAAGARAFLAKDVLPHDLLHTLREAGALARHPNNLAGPLDGQAGGNERDRSQVIGSYRGDGTAHSTYSG